MYSLNRLWESFNKISCNGYYITNTEGTGKYY
jgi:hypothetical protein